MAVISDLFLGSSTLAVNGRGRFTSVRSTKGTPQLGGVSHKCSGHDGEAMPAPCCEDFIFYERLRLRRETPSLWCTSWVCCQIVPSKVHSPNMTAIKHTPFPSFHQCRKSIFLRIIP